MPRDFTLNALSALYAAYRGGGYQPVTFEKYMTDRPAGRSVILRHDVDLRPGHALRVAQIQNVLGIRATYYIRVVPSAFDPVVIERISALGHEIGYHYEDLSLCRGDSRRALDHFSRSLERLRAFYPVRTICMHGSPLSRWDNRLLWRDADYRAFGIVGEPYFDLDFTSGLYLTDTGRRWDGDRYSVRDRMDAGTAATFHSTFDIIRALNDGRLPDFIMQNFHPQRWMDDLPGWVREWGMQHLRNRAKMLLRRFRR